MKNKNAIFLFLLLFIFPTLNIFVGDIEYVTSSSLVNLNYDIKVDLKDEDFPDLSAENMSDLLGLSEMWELGYNGSGVKVAVLDTGIDENHAELSGQVIYTIDLTGESGTEGMDYNGHGTVLAGIIASKGVGSGLYHGVAPGVSLINIKVMNGTGEGYLEWVEEGIEIAVEYGADVLSISLGSDPIGWDYVHDEVEDAWEDNVAIVVAAGNEGPEFETINTPGDVMEAITVGSCALDEDLLAFSSAGPTDGKNLCKPELIAPGAYLIGPASSEGEYEDPFDDGGNAYATLSGTSVSTPVVSGMVALLIQATDANVNKIKVALMESATEIEDYSQYRQGYGIPSCIDAYDLLLDEDWEPALFLPGNNPQEPLEISDVLDHPLVVITGKKYKDPYFETDLPLILPEVDEIDGHYLLELELDMENLDQNINDKGYISLMSKDDDELAQVKIKLVVTSTLNIVSLLLAAFFILALSSLAAFMIFNSIGKRQKLDILGTLKCDPKVDPTCKITVKK